jgi:hypothetical protein
MGDPTVRTELRRGHAARDGDPSRGLPYLWPTHNSATSKQIADAFKRQTKMEIADYFTVGAAVLARLILRGVKGDGLPGIKPAHYFSSAKMPASDWQPFFDLTARDLDDLADEVRAETKQYGETPL